MGMLKSLYDSDFYAWTQQQAQLLRNKALSDLDIIHLAAELEDMGRSEKTRAGKPSGGFCCCTC